MYFAAWAQSICLTFWTKLPKGRDDLGVLDILWDLAEDVKGGSCATWEGQLTGADYTQVFQG